MKIGILGDTHRNKNYIDKAIKHMNDCDLILHTGDNFQDSIYIHKTTNITTLGVVGNCDFEEAEDEILFETKGYNIFICHGHKYGVKYGIEKLKDKAKKLNADVVVFGHSHEYLHEFHDGILFLNPGSISLPRGSIDRSFIIMELDYENININKIIL
ncbi:hypothetical protein SAMN05661008_00080 [Alkalithermobacter thermoalcaliphilus JW-YL-7 = DSM 7308]|uniref:Phosphoesterase n=1 Tax=Alkalithermobacter thermoalcaliphilus JW-YL-7 = DSM 7308 TaxID=1121328 RepID=A0A150FRZ5_CLOPD|nr:phosphodiesterase, MJ0936 family [[Clostridium] paradoxum JW-YL-7 = DSM 7308]SHK36028.1 hypothetical protein SAMN05661008_00080 [[Clostridium] paradoxum JW-YL-7 = DSM 7308]